MKHKTSGENNDIATNSRYDRPKVLIIVPAYNEADNLTYVIQEIYAACRESDKAAYSILVINDGSTDNSKEVLSSAGVAYISMPFNVGIGAAMQTGYQYALENKYDIAIQIDGDGQHDPALIDSMVDTINEGYDAVIGSRFIDRQGYQSTKLRRGGITILSGLISFLYGIKILDVTSGLRAVNSSLIHIYANDYSDDYAEPEAIVQALGAGARVKEIPAVMRERQNGESSINAWKSFYYMLKVSLAVIMRKVCSGRKV